MSIKKICGKSLQERWGNQWRLVDSVQKSWVSISVRCGVRHDGKNSILCA